MSALFRRCLPVFGEKRLGGCLKEFYSKSNQWYKNYYLHTSSALNVVGQEIKMPALSPTMTEGKIIQWLKKVGEPIKPGDALCEIQTDKAVMVFETEEDGILAKILIGDNNDVKVGSLIGLMVSPGEDWKEVEAPTNDKIIDIKKSSLVEDIPPFVEFSGTEVKMPSLSPTMTEGTIIKWLKQEGEKISPGDAICEIQTDKAVMVFEIEEEGILARILAPENTPGVKVGTLIALIVNEGEDWKNVTMPKTVSVKDEKPILLKEKLTHYSPSVPVRKFGPAVRFLLDLYKLDSNSIHPTGRTGNILKKDVLKHISQNHLMPKPPATVPLPLVKKQKIPEIILQTERSLIGTKPSLNYTDIEVSNIRGIIAKRLTQSKSEIPHGYAVIDSKIDNLVQVREELKHAGYNLSVNDFIIKAVAAALRECPFVNSLFVNEKVVPLPEVDVSIAVATSNGLITPIIKSADSKHLVQISQEVRSLADRARKGILQPHEFQGGSFTISNLGMFGVRQFSAIINPPQCGILAVGCNRLESISDTSSWTVITCTLSFDQRAIDGEGVAYFLNSLQYYLQSPSLLVLNQLRKSAACSIA